MTEVAKLNVASKENSLNQELIGELESLLKRAKNGEFTAMTGVIFRYDNSFMTFETAGTPTLQCVGALAILQHDVINNSRITMPVADETN